MIESSYVAIRRFAVRDRFTNEPMRCVGRRNFLVPPMAELRNLPGSITPETLYLDAGKEKRIEKDGSKRFRKVLRDSILGFTKTAINRLCTLKLRQATYGLNAFRSFRNANMAHLLHSGISEKGPYLG
eukprot:IDg5873t1